MNGRRIAALQAPVEMTRPPIVVDDGAETGVEGVELGLLGRGGECFELCFAEVVGELREDAVPGGIDLPVRRPPRRRRLPRPGDARLLAAPLGGVSGPCSG